ncbi:unnamed protein product [Gongylonema pulchrum]|uniref:Dynein heavy chain AAA lid domain-containing protein n=1 Tax=Gongylonema pulchrum TaxID=637853 RepID=A0A3P7M3P6_9BILA|nr:unnamed protein product [Gongylonema pulchrum]
MSSMAPQRITKPPAERPRLYFLVCWLHALVQERTRYTPLGWANSYEFSDADLRVACDTLDAAVDAVAMGRANKLLDCFLDRLFTAKSFDSDQVLINNVDGKGTDLCIPDGNSREHLIHWVENIQYLQLPSWLGLSNNAEKVLLTKLLDCFLDRLFTAKSFDSDQVLINNVDGKGTDLCIPDGNSREHLIHWVENIQYLQLPNWLGLSNNAEKVLLTVRGESMLANLLKVSDEELAFTGDDQKTQAPPWMSNIPKLKRSVENIKDPLFRFFEREVNHGIHLLADVRSDLMEVRYPFKTS